jgi:hypothetical protein
MKGQGGDHITYSGVFGGLFILNVLLPTSSNIWMALALLASIYFLRRKENRFWRSLLLAMSGLVFGVIASLGLLSVIPINEFARLISTGIILLVMWLVTTLLR